MSPARFRRDDFWHEGAPGFEPRSTDLQSAALATELCTLRWNASRRCIRGRSAARVGALAVARRRRRWRRHGGGTAAAARRWHGGGTAAARRRGRRRRRRRTGGGERGRAGERQHPEEGPGGGDSCSVATDGQARQGLGVKIAAATLRVSAKVATQTFRHWDSNPGRSGEGRVS